VLAWAVVLVACASPAAAPAQGRDAGPRDASAPASVDDLAAAVRAFPRGEITPISLADQLPGAILKIADGDEATEIAIALDMASKWDPADALVLALASDRAKLVGRRRFALVSCTNHLGEWKVRIESGFTGEPYEILRAARKIDNLGSVSGRGAYWSCLAGVAGLGWSSSSQVRRQIILISEDRSGSGMVAETTLPAIDAKARMAAIAWARSSQATLHVLRPEATETERTRSVYEPELDTGIPLAQVAGLFRLGSTAVVQAGADLPAEIDRALAHVTAGTSGSVDVALVVDRSGRMGAALGDLRRALPVLERFVTVPGHRLALITWDERGRPKIVAPLTTESGTLSAALAATRRGSPGRWPTNVVGAVGAARRLAWGPGARKAVVAMTASPATEANPMVLDWTDTDSVVVVLIEGPTQSSGSELRSSGQGR
jgi:hypothetical protein